jgi:hypothetical protein
MIGDEDKLQSYACRSTKGTMLVFDYIWILPIQICFSLLFIHMIGDQASILGYIYIIPI